MSGAAELERARALFQSFQGRDPTAAEIRRVICPKRPPLVLEVGQLLQLAYIRAGDGEQYRHNFEDPLARVYVTENGRQMYIVGGNYQFSPRGFLR